MADAKNEVAVAEKSALPAHLQGGKTSRFGNIDPTRDLIIPRVKLLQATSPEIAESLPGAKIGDFWHTIAEQSLGPKVRVVPLILRSSVVLWAPRNDDRGVLARSSDTINWDKGYEDLEFEVKIKGVNAPVKYQTGPNVKASGLAEFGSGIPGDPNSRPAASLTYNMMFYLPDFDTLSPAIVINTRSSIKAAKMLLSKIELSPVDHFAQEYIMSSTDETGDEGPYKGYKYTANGYVEAGVFERTKELYSRFEPMEWRTNDESEAGETGDAGGKPKGKVSNDF